MVTHYRKPAAQAYIKYFRALGIWRVKLEFLTNGLHSRFWYRPVLCLDNNSYQLLVNKVQSSMHVHPGGNV